MKMPDNVEPDMNNLPKEMEEFLNVHAYTEIMFTYKVWPVGARMVMDHNHLVDTPIGTRIMHLWDVYDVFGKLHSLGVARWGIFYAKAYYYKHIEYREQFRANHN